MNEVSLLSTLESYHQRGFNLIPLKPRSKMPLVKWKDYQLTAQDFTRYLSRDSNWAIKCDEKLHVLDFDDIQTYAAFMQKNGDIFRNAPTVRTGRGYHVWFKPKRPVSSFSRHEIEVKGLGSLVVVPPSVHPSGAEYHFEKALDGELPEIDIEGLLAPDVINQATRDQPSTKNTPSDFALRYGKSPYPQSLCGKATKILTRTDGNVKHLVSLRCWKWNCPKCAPLLKRYWLNKLGSLSFRFILRLPSMGKPATFLRHVGKPDYIHIVANGKSWLFLVDGDAEKVWTEAQQAGYVLVASGTAGGPTSRELGDFLEQALCLEEKALNTRRKISHSRGFVEKTSESNNGNESKQKDDCSQEKDNMNTSRREPLAWDSEVVMKSIEEVAKELGAQGWKIIWQSEVEALAVKGNAVTVEDIDIVELIEKLGVSLRKTGGQYMGLCPFHDDRNPSLSANREKGLWHCFGCGRGGDVRKFIKEWQGMQ